MPGQGNTRRFVWNISKLRLKGLEPVNIRNSSNSIERPAEPTIANGHLTSAFTLHSRSEQAYLVALAKHLINSEILAFTH